MNIEIDHLGIAVKNIDEGLDLYRLLGLVAVEREYIAAERVNVAMLRMSENPTGSRIELIEAVDAESAVAKFLEKRGPGLHHVALRLDDLEAVLGRLKAEGARLLNEPRIGAGGHRYVFIHPSSTGGVLLELIQR